MKAFTKGEKAILVRQYNETVFSYRRVEVVSCGVQRMTLKDATTGEMLGSDFEPLIGFGSLRTNMTALAAEFAAIGRPIHHCYRTGVFKDMTDEEAAAFTVSKSAEYLAWEIIVAERNIRVEQEEYGETRYYHSQVKKLAALKEATPSAHKW